MALVRKQIVQLFSKKHGLVLKADSLAFLHGKLDAGALSSEELIQAIDEIVSEFRARHAAKAVIEKQDLEEIFGKEKATVSENLTTHTSLPSLVSVISAYEWPKWVYSSEAKRFER
ncbi:hypothetical protein HDU96_006875 [Phlyctochytrium bullatum]|nr:hypothetical protein HDU96_006875 [Phlyctochytrium bullatum]